MSSVPIPATVTIAQLCTVQSISNATSGVTRITCAYHDGNYSNQYVMDSSDPSTIAKFKLGDTWTLTLSK
jgi:hypothetical protein